MTKQKSREYVYAYIGINRETLRVETAYQTRGGTLELWRDEARLSTPLGMGRYADSECLIVFGLTDVRMLPINEIDSEIGRRVYEERTAKAEQLKLQRNSAVI